MGRVPRVIMASFYSYPLQGGAEKQGQLLASALCALGAKVIYVSARLPGMPSYEIRGGVPIYRVLCAPWRKPWRRIAASTIYPLSLGAFLCRVGRHFDVFHCHGAFDISAAPMVVVARWLGRVSLVKHASTDEYSILRASFLLGRVLEPLVRRADAYVANSPAVHKVLLGKYKHPPERCFYIPNGIPPQNGQDTMIARARPGLDLDGPIAVCVAQFDERKNQISAIRAWPQIISQYPTAKLILVGEGYGLEKCRLEARELGLDGQVRFVGRVTNVREYLDAADIFLFPSLGPEGMSNAIMEAMAHELPCAVSDIAENHALITQGEDGLFFDPTDQADLVRGVLKLFSDRSLAKRLGANAKAKIDSEYGIDRVAALYLQLYGHLLYGGMEKPLADLQPGAVL